MEGSEEYSMPTDFSSNKVSFSTEFIQSRFTLGDEIGSGSSATVRVCVDNQNGQKFACKSISMSRDASKINEVQREIAVMEKLGRHPHLVSLHHVFENGGRANLVMELCEGGDLLDEVIKNGSIRETAAASTIFQVAAALNYCHENGIMHRDVKPENIFLTRRSGTVGNPEFGQLDEATFDVKLGDFGLATFSGPYQEAFGFVGSPFYIAPEILKRLNYGFEADIWSLGVVMHVILSGEFPFSGNSEALLFSQIVRSRVDLNGPPWSAISASAKSLLKAMLAHDPKARPTAKQILQHPWIQSTASNYSASCRESLFGKTDISDIKDSFRIENTILPAPVKVTIQLPSTSNTSDPVVTESPISVLGGIPLGTRCESRHSSSGLLTPLVSSYSEFRDMPQLDFKEEEGKHECAGYLMGSFLISYYNRVALLCEYCIGAMKASLHWLKRFGSRDVKPSWIQHNRI